MAYVMTAEQFASKAKEIATKYNTTYMWGAIGVPVTNNSINTLKAQYPSWYTAARVAKFNSLVGKNYWGFDCVCTLKALLWGWCGDATKNYGGAKYLSNGVPDLNAGGLFTKCTGISTNFSNIVVGEAVWMQGHIGIYIGNGLAVETTTNWTSKCMITAVGNIGSVSGYNTRTWTKHGKLPWINYSGVTSTTQSSASTSTSASNSATVAAKSFSASIAGTYTTTANLNIRKGPGTSYTSMAVLPKGTKVQNYGYYTEVNGVKWLYVQVTYKNVKYTGFISSSYTTK